MPGLATFLPKLGTDPAKWGEQVNAALEALPRAMARACPLLDGVLLQGGEVLPVGAAVDHTSAPNGSLVKHALGRPAVGYLILRQNADARVWELGTKQDPDPTTRDLNKLPQSQLLLRSSAPVVLTLWVL